MNRSIDFEQPVLGPLEFEEGDKVLSERDREFLKVGGQNIAEKILADFPNQLPEIILLPDTGGRPLYYFFKPIFQRAAEQRREAEPKFHFVSYFPAELDNIRSQDPSALRYEERVKKRLQEIPNISSSNAIIIDEYLLRGRTVDGIRQALQEDIPAYALVAAGPTKQHLPHDTSVGTIDTDDVSHGFDWRYMKEAIGVDKQYTQPLSKRMHGSFRDEGITEAMSKLRQELSEEGKIISERIMPTPLAEGAR